MFSLCLFGPVISLSLHFLRSKMKLTRCQLQGLDMRFQEDKYRAGKFPFFHGLAQCRFYKGSSWRPWISLFPPYQLAYPQPEQSGPSWPSPEAVFTITTPHALQKRGAKEMQQRGLCWPSSWELPEPGTEVQGCPRMDETTEPWGSMGVAKDGRR